jgi:hypothetical protein
LANIFETSLIKRNSECRRTKIKEDNIWERSNSYWLNFQQDDRIEQSCIYWILLSRMHSLHRLCSNLRRNGKRPKRKQIIDYFGCSWSKITRADCWGVQHKKLSNIQTLPLRSSNSIWRSKIILSDYNLHIDSKDKQINFGRFYRWSSISSSYRLWSSLSFSIELFASYFQQIPGLSYQRRWKRQNCT